MRSFEVAPEEVGERLDKLVAGRLEVSRSVARRMIEEGLARVDGVEETSPSYKACEGERVEVRLVEKKLEPEDIPVPVVFEDSYLLVVEKPAGLVVHPGAGNRSGTLVNALLERGIAGGEEEERPGVVHRLDRDTSGLMVVAKGEEAYSELVAALAERRVKRVYRAIVVGEGLPEMGTVDSPLGRDPTNPTLMVAGVGRPAVTHFEVVREAAAHTMLRVRLETGRTHQIRVHLKAIGHPVYADPLYGEPVPGQRLWLHAESLAFVHPVTGKALKFESQIPVDLREAARALDPVFLA
ncbi:MAG TPA: RluA family pseudouridine synthase [Rubrobacteraceae bacterium]|nr:RluA family pseudouridine synthase [Rubrobacteraceae bacterium]